MSYRHSGSKTFFSDEWKDPAWSGAGSGVCDEHKDTATGRSLCHKTIANWVQYTEAWWNGLRVPLKVSEICPGTSVINRKLLNLSVEAMWARGGYILPLDIGCLLRILGDGAKIFDTGKLTMPEGKFTRCPYAVNESLDAISEVDFYLWQKTENWGGTPGSWLNVHTRLIKIDWEWYSDMPPEYCNVGVAVRNIETFGPIKKAFVKLMSGAVVKRSGYTDGGRVDFVNVEDGSYTLKVSAGGYESLERSITVEPPAVEYEVSLVPIPVPPIPDWVMWMLYGTIAVGALVVVPKLIRRKEKPPIIVVK